MIDNVKPFFNDPLQDKQEKYHADFYCMMVDALDDFQKENDLFEFLNKNPDLRDKWYGEWSKERAEIRKSTLSSDGSSRLNIQL